MFSCSSLAILKLKFSFTRLLCQAFVRETQDFFFCCSACGISAPWPGPKLTRPALAARSLNHWASTEVPLPVFLPPSGKGRFFLTLSLWLLTPLLFSVLPEGQSGSQRLLTVFVPELVYSWARGDRCGPWNTAFLYRPQRTWASWRAGGACLWLTDSDQRQTNQSSRF